uniref:Uncharacterized protein n=1 Tax=Solanum tuberosum TaxID=4113 RepID=M1DUT2_SOLTU
MTTGRVVVRGLHLLNSLFNFPKPLHCIITTACTTGRDNDHGPCSCPWSSLASTCTMDPKQALTYAVKGMSKSAAPSRHLIVGDDDDYIPPATTTSPTTPHTTRNRAH